MGIALGSALGIKLFDSKKEFLLLYGLFLAATLPVKMLGPFWSVWYKIALVEVGVSLP